MITGENVDIIINIDIRIDTCIEADKLQKTGYIKVDQHWNNSWIKDYNIKLEIKIQYNSHENANIIKNWRSEKGGNKN